MTVTIDQLPVIIDPSFDQLTKRFEELRREPSHSRDVLKRYFYDPVSRTVSTTRPAITANTSPSHPLTTTTLVASKIFKWALGIGVTATLILAISLLSYFQIIPLPCGHLADLIGIGVSGTTALTSLIIALINKRHPPKTPPLERSSSITLARESSVRSEVESIAPTSIEPTLDKLIPVSELANKRTMCEMRAPEIIQTKMQTLVHTCRHNRGNLTLQRRHQAALLAEQEIAHLTFYGRIKGVTPASAAQITHLKEALNNLLDPEGTNEHESTIASILQDYQTNRKTIPNYASISEIYDIYSTAAHDMTIFINRDQHTQLPHLLHEHPTLVTGMALYKAQLSIPSTESPEAQATQTAINALVDCRLQEAALEPASRPAKKQWKELFQTPWT